MIQTLVKQGEKCYCLYVNLTTSYISFKIEVGKLLQSPKGLDKDYLAVEHNDDEVNYLKPDDIFKTEEDAMRALVKMLNKKLKKENKYERI